MSLKLKLSRNQFAQEVEDIVCTGTDYLDAISTVCSNHDIEPETAGSYVVGPLKEKMLIESIRLKRLRRELNDDIPQLPTT